jgi:hypothetical protein
VTTPNAWTRFEDAYVRHLVEEGRDSAEIAALCANDGIARRGGIE